MKFWRSPLTLNTVSMKFSDVFKISNNLYCFAGGWRLTIFALLDPPDGWSCGLVLCEIEIEIQRKQLRKFLKISVFCVEK